MPRHLRGKRKLGKNVKRAVHAINYGASIKSVVRNGHVSLRRVKKAYSNLGYKLTVINNTVYLNRTYQ